MAFPADGVEATYRNHIDDVAELLRTNHQNHYLIYNLSNRNYDTTKFEENRVLKWCGFPDHHPPPLFLLFKIVHSMCDWLRQDPENIVVVHCLVGNYTQVQNFKTK
jgi:protein-tyrosine phosphatase